MAFTRSRLDNQLWNHFEFFSDGGADGGPIEAITGGDAGETETFIITEIRLTLSIVCPSIIDFVVKLSAAVNGSEFNHTLISQAMSDISNYRWTGSTLITSGDTLGFLFSYISATNIYGLEVHGWAIAS